MSNNIEKIEHLHRQIIKDYIMDFHNIYTKPVTSSTLDIDPYKLCLDEYFTGVNDDIWLKLENRPKINKAVQKKLSELMIDLVLSTPHKNVYTNILGDDICKKYNVDLRFGTQHFMIIKYHKREITPVIRNNIINTFQKIKKEYPLCYMSLGLINGPYESIKFSEDIVQISGDALLNSLLPYKNSTERLNMLLIDELSYCFNNKINSSLQMESIFGSSKDGIQDKQILPSLIGNIINNYEVTTPKKTTPKKTKTIIVSNNEDSSSSESDSELVIPITYKINTTKKETKKEIKKETKKEIKKETNKKPKNESIIKQMPKKRGRPPKNKL